MPRRMPLHVVTEFSRHNRRRMYFFRKGKGKRIRLPDTYPSPEFEAAYQAARTGQKPKPVRVSTSPNDRLQWLVDRYLESATWAALSLATRKQRGLIFKEAIERAKNPKFTAITRKNLQASVDARHATPAQANNFLKAMRGLFTWAVKSELTEENPCLSVDRLRYKTDGFPAWTVDDAKQFCAKWPVGSQARLAFALLLASGLRRGDVHRAGRQHLNGNIFSMKTGKTGTTVTVRFPKFLLGLISQTPTGDLHFLVKADGMPFASKESFGNWFSDRCREAKLDKGKSAHGIRKLAATLAADGGATTHELMAHFGWVKVEQAEIYTRGADRKRLGVLSSDRVADQVENIMPLTQLLGEGLGEENETKTTVKK